MLNIEERSVMIELKHNTRLNQRTTNTFNTTPAVLVGLLKLISKY